MSSLGIRRDDAHVYVGVMSGTSLDGISAAVARFPDRLGAPGAKGDQRASLLAFRVTAYNDEQHARLRQALSGGTVKTAIVMHFLGASRQAADQALTRAGGIIRRAVGREPPPVADDTPRRTP